VELVEDDGLALLLGRDGLPTALVLEREHRHLRRNAVFAR
jgi:hypothetical protein